MPVKTKLPWSAVLFVPKERSLFVLSQAVQRCRGCDLYRNATQAVFGEVESHTAARQPKVDLMMIGEQPGDSEDKEGHPFVGPAGRLLDKCLEEAGIDRRRVCVTNAVKHFKWVPRGKRRIHKKPSLREIHACRPWLDAELETVRPKVIVCLGATAAQALLGSGFRYRGPGAAGLRIQGHAGAWAGAARRRTASRGGNVASVGDPAGTDRGRAAQPDAGAH